VALGPRPVPGDLETHWLSGYDIWLRSHPDWRSPWWPLTPERGHGVAAAEVPQLALSPVGDGLVPYEGRAGALRGCRPAAARWRGPL